METNRWTYKVATWRDAEWQAREATGPYASYRPRRMRGRPSRRWDDILTKYAAKKGYEDWKKCAANWDEEEFIKSLL